MIFTRKPIPIDGDTKRIVSYCLLPLFWNRNIYWLEKVQKVYKYTDSFFEEMGISDYNPGWYLEEVYTCRDEVG